MTSTMVSMRKLLVVKDIVVLSFVEHAQTLLVDYFLADLEQPSAADWFAGSTNKMDVEVNGIDISFECFGMIL